MNLLRRILLLVSVFLLGIAVSSCVDQHREEDKADGYRIVATSPATAEICSKLNIPLVAVCNTNKALPKEYENLAQIGMPMNPDLEKIKDVQGNMILGPQSLKGDLEPKYKSIGVDYIFLNLDSIEGMYDSIEKLGKKFGKEEEAEKLKEEHNSFMEKFRAKTKGMKKPKVLVLMGLPGSYVVATPKSYVGSLVEEAGGENVYTDDFKAFLTANPEDMETKKPDVILRTAHALPEEVQKMFDDEFRTNPIWKHFEAVENGKVYDLDNSLCGMSATFDYPDALKNVQEAMYGKQ